MKAPEAAVQRKSKPRTFILRPYRRIPVRASADYLSGDRVGKAMVTNLSCSGMRLSGQHALATGTSLVVRVSVNERLPAVEIARARVCWVNGYDCGLSIEAIDPPAARRIAAILNDQASRGHYGA